MTPKPAITDREFDAVRTADGEVYLSSLVTADDVGMWLVSADDLAARDEAVRREALAEAAKDMHSDTHNSGARITDRDSLQDRLLGLLNDEYGDEGWREMGSLRRIANALWIDLDLPTAVRREVSAALTREADHIAERIRTHGAGLPHGCDTGESLVCQTLRTAEGRLRAAGWKGEG